MTDYLALYHLSITEIERTVLTYSEKDYTAERTQRFSAENDSDTEKVAKSWVPRLSKKPHEKFSEPTRITARLEKLFQVIEVPLSD